MALTVTKVSGPSAAGGRWESLFTVVADNSYPTGGWALTKNTLGASANDPSAIVGVLNHGKGYLAVYDNAAQKLLLYRQTAATGALAEVPNTTDLSAVITAANPIVVKCNYQLGI